MDNLTVIVPYWNGHDTIGALVESLPDSLPIVIAVDHGSKPLPDLPRDATVVHLKNRGYFSGAVNVAADQCVTDFVVLNQDVHFQGQRWLDLIADNRERYATIGEGIRGMHPAWPKGYIHGVFQYIRRDAWDMVGPYNDVDWPLWGSTCEWQLRACRLGFEALPVTQVPGLVHERGDESYGSSIKKALSDEPHKRRKLIRTPPLVSVIINCYNYGRYLPDAINSLIGGPTCLGDMRPQTFQSFEVIIVDDGSTDETAEIAKSLADPWKGIRYMYRRNGGTAAANNTGIRASFGHAVTPLCADDMMRRERLEMMYRAWEQDPTRFYYDDVLLFGDGRHRYKVGKDRDVGFNQPVRYWRIADYDFDDVLAKNRIHCGIMFSKDAWKAAGGYPEVMRYGREDWAFNVALGRAGVCGQRVDYAGYLYRQQGQNRTMVNTSPSWMKRFSDQMKALYPRLYRGERPMACCGRRKTAPASRKTKSSPRRSSDLAGKDGLVLLEYMGGNVGTMTIHGEATRRAYRFGRNKSAKRSYVDAQDVDGFLAMRAGRKPMFRRAKIKTKPPIPTFDPGEHTVAEIREIASNYDKPGLEMALDAEIQGKNRVTAISAIKEAMGD